MNGFRTLSIGSTLVITFVASCATVPQTEPQSAKPATQSASEARLSELVERWFDSELRRDPGLGSSIGDSRFNDQYPVTITETFRSETRSLIDQYRSELGAIDESSLSSQGWLTRNVFERTLDYESESLRFPSHLQPLNQFYAVPSGFARMGSGAGDHPFQTVKDYEDFLKRVDGYLLWVDAAIANMRRGMEAGVVQPRVLMEKTLPQIEAQIVDDPEASIFYTPIRSLPESISGVDRVRLADVYRETIRTRLVPSYKRLHEFVRDEYLPHCRESAGLGALPDGPEWYAALVRERTTTSLTPDEIHRIGLSEVERIHGEMRKVTEGLGFQGTLSEFFDTLSADPRFHFTSKEEMLGVYREAKIRIDSLTPRLFDVIPKADYEIRPVEAFREKSASGGSYAAATPDGSRAGVFYLNTYEPENRSRNGVESLLLHEGSPGHHFQISIQRELTGLPRFRRFGGFTAYIEGWGLYAESLGKDLGVYTDPYQYFGSLSAELWRAIRLVIDTGIHAKGWSREQALEYAASNSPQSKTSVVSEVERFMAIPGQALAYKIGQLKIAEIRARAETTLGSKFDVKRFHGAVLRDGALPLDVFEEKMNIWIQQQGMETKTK